MDSQPPENREAMLADLLSEKSLWAVYRQSRRIPFSRINNVTGIIFGVLTTITSCLAANAAVVADHISAVATVSFNTSISLLGFLLAGFSFFATVADKSMFCRMAEVRHEGSGLSYLKYNFYLFMRVFYEYSVVAVISFAVMLVLQPNSGVRTFVELAWKCFAWPQKFAAPVALDVFLLSCCLGLLSGSFVYLLMQLKSFIFNVFHVVMTSIRWALEAEYAKPPDPPPPPESTNPSA